MSVQPFLLGLPSLPTSLRHFAAPPARQRAAALDGLLMFYACFFSASLPVEVTTRTRTGPNLTGKPCLLKTSVHPLLLSISATNREEVPPFHGALLPLQTAAAGPAVARSVRVKVLSCDVVHAGYARDMLLLPLLARLDAQACGYLSAFFPSLRFPEG